MHRHRIWLLASLGCVFVVAVNCGKADVERLSSTTPGVPPPAQQSGPLGADICGPGGIAPGAFERAGLIDDRTALLPNGRRVRPAGTIVPLSDMAMGLALHPDGVHAYVVHAEARRVWDGIWVVNLQTGAVEFTYPDVQAYHGIALNTAGDRLYVAGLGRALVYRFAVAADASLSPLDPVTIGTSVIDVTVSADGRTVYALSNANSRIYEIDAETGAVQTRMQAGTNPFAFALDEGRGRLFVTNLNSATLGAFDLATGEALAFVPVGKNPEGLAVDRARGRVYVANSDSDSVSVVDADTLAVVATWDLTNNDGRLTGGALNAVWLDPGGGRLFAALARRNEVDIIDTAAGTRIGAIPTGHYPVDGGVTADGATLITLVAKGWGSHPGDLDATPGQLNILTLPTTQAEFDALTAEVDDNNLRVQRWFPEDCTGQNLPPALAGGPDRPVRHVVLIVKENKTYDALLGDDPTLGDGDPNLCLFPEAVTPNHHRLARQFSNFDNFYSDPERSIQGHLWTTMADCNDYVERIHQIQFALYGFEPATIAQGGTIFDNCLANGVSFRNYGEFPGFGHHLMDDFEPFIDHKYPLWTMSVPDVEKAREFIRELEQGIFPEFVYITLPNDHTYGGRAGAPVPRHMVGDNDAGLGLIVEAISRSPFWPETAIFVIEDDPQGPPDHLHSHRSICFAIGPHVRRGYVSSVHYSIPSIYATIERILELPPLNRNTLEAPPMVDVFLSADEEPDFTPYEAVPNPVPYEENPDGTKAAELSARLDFSFPDRAEGVGLILWQMIKGDEPIPPYARYSDK